MGKSAPAPSKYAAELEAAFRDEGITVRDVVATVNAVRKDAMRYSTKDGEPTGPDHATRAKMAVVLLDLMGLPAKSSAVPTPASIKDILRATGQETEDELFS